MKILNKDKAIFKKHLKLASENEFMTTRKHSNCFVVATGVHERWLKPWHSFQKLNKVIIIMKLISPCADNLWSNLKGKSLVQWMQLILDKNDQKKMNNK